MAALAALLLFLRWAMQLWLAKLNQRHAELHAASVPPAFAQLIDPATYARSVQYTLAKLRLGRWEDTLNLLLTLFWLFSGVLPAALNAYVAWRGDSAWAMGAFLLAISLAISVTGWPLAWYEQFRLEQRFGFNTSTQGLWWMDRLKVLLLSVVLGYPLLVLILKIVRVTGTAWWLWAWACLLGFQFALMVLGPVLILPLFNKFTPLPDGGLKDRLWALAKRARFGARSIQVIDGSKRSRHSNAFFTGFGRFRKIVLFDTLIQQLTAEELEAVLAHEIGHHRLRHIPKLLLASAGSLFAAFFILSALAEQDWFYRAFGFLPGAIEPALLLFVLLSGSVSFWLSPVFHFWSRLFEHQADLFAAQLTGGPESLLGALRKLHEKNLSNLVPHPWYSGFYYSHPTLLEREKVLLRSVDRSGTLPRSALPSRS
jgi:STE24 endopeptidase